MNTSDDAKAAGGDTLAGLDNDAGGGATETPGAFNLVPNAEGWREVEMDATPARIPANWQVKTLADITTELPKSRMPAGAATANGKVPFFCSSQVPKRTDQALLDGEAVLLGTGGVATVHHGRGGFAWSTDTWALTPTEETCGKWLHETLAAARERIDQTAFKGSGLRHLDKHAMRTWRIACPSKPEQTRIAGVLAWQEAQIEDLRKARKVEQKRLTWLVDELLSGRVRVVERSGGAPTVVERGDDGVVTETLGAFDLVANMDGWREVEANGATVSVPLGWRVASIGEEIRFTLGHTPSKTGENYCGDINWVTISNLGGGRDITQVSGRIKTSRTRILPCGSLLGSFKMTVGRFGILSMRAATNEAIVGAAPDDAPNHSLDYLRHALVTPFQEGATTNGQGVKLLNTKTINRLNFIAPKRAEQKRIAAVICAQERQVADLDALIVIEQKRLAWLADELLSGRIRVVESAA